MSEKTHLCVENIAEQNFELHKQIDRVIATIMYDLDHVIIFKQWLQATFGDYIGALQHIKNERFAAHRAYLDQCQFAPQSQIDAFTIDWNHNRFVFAGQLCNCIGHKATIAHRWNDTGIL